jgi:YidC/Oxa1 family membrane protein insertase
MQDNKNLILAVALSAVVLMAAQYFIWGPQQEEARLLAEQRQAEISQSTMATSETSTPAGGSSIVPTPGATTSAATPGNVAPPTGADREAVLQSSQRVTIDTPDLTGSINLTGGRVDDLSLKNYREEIDPESPIIQLFSPSGSTSPYYAEFGWVKGQGTTASVPGSQTVWTLTEGSELTPQTPVTVSWDNGEGLVFKRTYAVDEHFLVTISDSVENTTDAAVSLFPYALVTRHGIPDLQNFFILHEGMIGFVGEEGLQEIDYDDLQEEGELKFGTQTQGWLGITDKYWASAIVPTPGEIYTPRYFHHIVNGRSAFQADFLGEVVEIAPNSNGEHVSRLFAGAKEVNVINSYREAPGIERFDLMIDWGWFYFITKPLFVALDWLYKLIGNFGLAILAVTVVLKIFFFPLANKSYASMANMKKVQPQLTELRERYKDDRTRQQQAMMELYKKEKINPLAGCLPVVLQIPVFFALYKVLFVTIEMRHAPFFGWIQDLAAPDPTSLFNLFGLIPWEPPQILMLGIWPLIMGVTMFVQMRLNPLPPDKTQAMIFTWMPVIFTFMLASFPAGLVIYWAWNNTLSIAQQAVIMRRQGVPVEIWKNTLEALGLGGKGDKGNKEKA